MTALSDSDKDPNLDEYAYEDRVDGSGGPGGGSGGGADDGSAGGADEHADNPHPDADGDVTTGPDDPAAPDDPTGVIDPKAD